MARYFFDLHECGTVLADHDGMEADHLAAARDIALAAARDVMCGEIGEGALCLSCFIEIRDDQRELLDRVMFRDAVQITGL